MQNPGFDDRAVLLGNGARADVPIVTQNRTQGGTASGQSLGSLEAGFPDLLKSVVMAEHELHPSRLPPGP